MVLVVTVLIFLVVLSLFVTPWIWCAMGRILRIEDLHYKKAFLTCILLMLIGLGFQILTLLLNVMGLNNLPFDLILSLSSLCVGLWFLKIRFNTTIWKSICIHLSTIVFAVVLALTIRVYAVQAFKIPSGAMEKTIIIGDYVLVNKFCYRFKGPMHGDIIVFKYPKDPGKDYIMRVVAVGGDTVEIRNKEVLVNGAVQKSDFALIADAKIYSDPDKHPQHLIRRDNFQPITIPENMLFVMGDNRDYSNDSRYWGTVETSAVRGKAFIIYWSYDKNSESVRRKRIGRAL